MWYNRQFDWLMRVHCDAIMHCDLWQCFVLSLPPPPPPHPLHHCFLTKNINKTIEHLIKIQNLSESKKEQTKGTKQFFYSSTCKFNQLGIRRICCRLDQDLSEKFGGPGQIFVSGPLFFGGGGLKYFLIPLFI